MSLVKHILTFDSGELSPWLDGRTDIAKYAGGCRTLENMIVRPQGGVTRRPGMEYRGQLYAGAACGKLVEFEIKGSASKVLALGGGKMKVFAGGVPVQSGGSDLAVTIPWADADLPLLRWIQINDVMFFTHPSYQPQKLSRVSDTSWTLADFLPAASATKIPLLAENTDDQWKINCDFAVTVTAWVGTSHAYAVDDMVTYGGLTYKCNYAHTSNAYTTLGAGGNRPDLGKTFVVRTLLSGNVTSPYWTTSFDDSSCLAGQSVNLTATKATWDALHVGAVFELASLREIWGYQTKIGLYSGDSAIAATSNGTTFAYSPVIVVQGDWTFTTSGNWAGKFYVEVSYDRGITWTQIRAYQSNSTSEQNFTTSGTEKNHCWMRLSFTAYVNVSGTGIPYGVLSVLDSRLRGLVQITRVTNSQAATGVAITPLQLGTTELWSECAWNPYQGYPCCVTLHQNRLVMAAPSRACHTIWGSATDDYSNFYPGTDADAAFRHTVIIGQREPIVWLASARHLVIGSGIGEFAMRGQSDDAAITPEFGIATRQSSFGTAVGGAGCVLADQCILFVQNGGRIIRELNYQYMTDRYESGNLTLLSDHIPASAVSDWALQRHPFQILWVVAGGVLYSLTYEKTQNIAAWARHPTAGTVLSVAVVRSTPDDEVWLCMQHGSAFTVERMASAITTQTDNGMWSDCCQTLASPYTLTGNPLSGLTVVGWNNGNVIGPGTLNSGFFTGLSGNVVVGRPYTSVLTPMIPEVPLPNGSSRSRELRIHRVVPNLLSSRGGRIGRTAGAADAIPAGSAASLFTGEIELGFDGSHDPSCPFVVLVSDPFPFSLRSLALKLNFYGDG